MLRLIMGMVTVFMLVGCINTKIHQGNVIDENAIWIIQEGDTRFAIESELGSPAIQDSAHPERVLYVEDYMDEATKTVYTRSIRIVYDSAWRAESIERIGFE